MVKLLLYAMLFIAFSRLPSPYGFGFKFALYCGISIAVPPFQPSQNRPFRRRLLWIPILLLLLLLGGGFAWYFWRPVETPAAPDDLVDSAAPAPAGELPNFTTDASANLTAESQTKNVPDLAYKSENFRMADIAIAGKVCSLFPMNSRSHSRFHWCAAKPLAKRMGASRW